MMTIVIDQEGNEIQKELEVRSLGN